jgi:hypothetical protein
VDAENPQPNAKIQVEIKMEDLTDERAEDAAPLNIENPKLYFESRTDLGPKEAVNGEVEEL